MRAMKTQDRGWLKKIVPLPPGERGMIFQCEKNNQNNFERQKGPWRKRHGEFSFSALWVNNIGVYAD